MDDNGNVGDPAARVYPTITAADDDFHDEAMTDHWWETETCWFSFNVPERRMGGWTYCQARPNAGLANGGVWVWDGSASFPWELPYHVDYSGLELADRAHRDLRDFAWPNGVHVRMLEPLTRYRVDYEDPGELELHLEFRAIIAPNPHPIGVAPFWKGRHFDQPGHVTGELVLHGERIAIDCYSFRDRSWGPRPMGRPKRRPPARPGSSRVGGGVGYCFGAAGPDDAWLTYSMPSLDGDPVVCGFLWRDGVYAHIVGGERRVAADRACGWPTRIEVEAVDDLGRTLEVSGVAHSRHWKGRGGDSLMEWTWGGLTGWGEDQSYLSRQVWEHQRDGGFE